MMTTPFPRQHGFTLIELMITLSVMAIMMAVAAPSFTDILAAQRMRSVAYDMTSDLVLARSEAVKRSANVNVEPAANGWVGGWTVRVPSTADVISSRKAAGSGVIFSTSPGTITFDLNGRLPTATPQRFGLSDGASRNRCISIDPSGRPNSVVAACP